MTLEVVGSSPISHPMDVEKEIANIKEYLERRMDERIKLHLEWLHYRDHYNKPYSEHPQFYYLFWLENLDSYNKAVGKKVLI